MYIYSMNEFNTPVHSHEPCSLFWTLCCREHIMLAMM